MARCEALSRVLKDMKVTSLCSNFKPIKSLELERKILIHKINKKFEPAFSQRAHTTAYNKRQ